MFGKLGDLANIMKRAQQMQADLAKVKAEIAELELPGSSANGQVQVVVSGNAVFKTINISSELLQAGDAEALEQFVLEAVNDALSKLQEQTKTRMSQVTQGLDIPGLM